MLPRHSWEGRCTAIIPSGELLADGLHSFIIVGLWKTGSRQEGCATICAHSIWHECAQRVFRVMDFVYEHLGAYIWLRFDVYILYKILHRFYVEYLIEQTF